MLYSDWITAVCALLEYAVVDPTSATPTGTVFDQVYARAIDYTENRMQRDIDFLASTVSDVTGVMTANSRVVTLPTTAVPLTSSDPLLLGIPLPPNTIISTTNGSPVVNVNWRGHGRNAGDDISLIQPLNVGGLTLGGIYQIIAIVDPNNFTLNVTFPATANDNKTVVGSAGFFIVAQQISLFVGGQKQPALEAVTRGFLDYAWPSDTSPGGPPLQWCPRDQASILVGPAPDQAYSYEVTGTQRFQQLSAANVQNFLTVQLPDLYVAASMVWFSGFQRDFGAQAEDPKAALSWEETYQGLLASSIVEEARKKFADMFPRPSKPVGLTAQAA